MLCEHLERSVVQNKISPTARIRTAVIVDRLSASAFRHPNGGQASPGTLAGIIPPVRHRFGRNARYLPRLKAHTAWRKEAATLKENLDTRA